MRRQHLALGKLFATLPVSLLLLSPHMLWAQMTRPQEEARFLNSSIQLRPVPDTRTHLGPVSDGLAMSVEAARRHQFELQARFFRTPTNNQAALNLQRPTGTAELLGIPRGFTGRVSSQWLTSTDATVHYSTMQPPDRLRYFGHHVPWAGPIILRVSQQAKAHPHLTGVLKLLQPQF